MIRFKDKTVYETTPASTIEEVTIYVNSFADIDILRKQFTESNMKRVEFDGIHHEFIIPLAIKAETSGERIAVTFINRKKTQVELNTQMIADLMAAQLEGLED